MALANVPEVACCLSDYSQRPSPASRMLGQAGHRALIGFLPEGIGQNCVTRTQPGRGSFPLLLEGIGETIWVRACLAITL